MWNNLRARHYSVLVLLAIVALETSAIAIDRLVLAESEEAFVLESSFQNNSFIQSFRMADASCAVLPVRINDLVTAHENKSTRFAKNPAPLNSVSLEDKVSSKIENAVVEPVISKSVSADFIAAAGDADVYSNFVEYSVQPGDSLSNIAELFGSKTEVIKQANKLDNGSKIKAGQTLKVPMQSDSMSYTVKKGDSLSRIANRFNVSIENIVNENNLKSHVLLAEQKIRIPVDNRSNIKMAKIEPKEEKTLPLVKSNTLEKVEDPTKLKLVKLDNKLPMAAAPASAKKVNIDFKATDVLTADTPAVAKAEPIKNTKESVELNLGKSTRAAVAAVPSVKKEEAVETKVAKVEDKVDSSLTGDAEVGFVYKVSKGDSLSKIASRFNTTVAQIQLDNNIDGDKVKLGQNLKINPNKKLYRVVKNEKVAAAPKDSEDTKTILNHKVKSGESLSTLAKKYNTTVSEIVNENNMTNTVVMVGQTLKIPSKKGKNFKITSVSTSKPAEKYSWKAPTKGWLSSPYGWRIHPVRKKRSFHTGIDLAAPKGTGIYCVAPGKVIYCGTRSGYGKLVIVSHENGLSTRYAHCSQILVKNGQLIKEGQLIAKVGATGVATGNHLHFEVRKNGKTQNPMLYLKSK